MHLIIPDDQLELLSDYCWMRKGHWHKMQFNFDGAFVMAFIHISGHALLVQSNAGDWLIVLLEFNGVDTIVAEHSIAGHQEQPPTALKQWYLKRDGSRLQGVFFECEGKLFRIVGYMLLFILYILIFEYTKQMIIEDKLRHEANSKKHLHISCTTHLSKE